ncbi:peroxiredoxin family protein [Bacillus massilinigeriensis]|uniref:peroxiredoxin family protein n=1 Tax=Bacillus massilionigeriensis TaxID=1805475 RepID=UPI00096B2589|nr:TlpA disulfide reductase family protein [Bacillus massilionigeriensis]
MLKKILAAVLLVGLTTVVFVQAMGTDSTKPSGQTQSQTTKDNLPGLKIGVKAPDFELNTLTGESVRLSDFKGKKIVLNFWATWCPPCKEEMPDMQKYYEKAGNDVVILAVNIDPQYDVAGFAKKMNAQFPILLDEKDTVNTLYQIMTVPTTYFIDEEGIIQNKYLTSLTTKKMKIFVDNM